MSDAYEKIRDLRDAWKIWLDQPQTQEFLDTIKAQRKARERVVLGSVPSTLDGMIGQAQLVAELHTLDLVGRLPQSLIDELDEEAKRLLEIEKEESETENA